MTTEEIYVALLDEGVDVWRPAPAYSVGAGTYIVLRPADYDAATERWEFPPGSAVVVEPRKTRDGVIPAAVRAAQTVANRRTA